MKDNKKNIVTIIVAVTLLLVFVIGLTYALFMFSGNGNRINQISMTSVAMSYTEAQNGITLTNAMPLSDAAGILLNDSNQTFEFTVSVATGSSVPVAWEVAAEKLTGSTLTNTDVRIYLEKKLSTDVSYTAVSSPSNFVPEASNSVIGTKSGKMILDQDSTTDAVVYNYKLRMWVSDTYYLTDEEKAFSVKINVYGKDNYQTINSINLGDDVTISEEETHTFTAAITPNDAINISKMKWCSSSNTVISGANSQGRCESGEYEITSCYGNATCRVTGVIEGTTTIVAKVNNYSDSILLTVDSWSRGNKYYLFTNGRINPVWGGSAEDNNAMSYSIDSSGYYVFNRIGGSYSAYSVNKIDLTSYKKIRATLVGYSPSDVQPSVLIDQQKYTGAAGVMNAQLNVTDTLDISSVSGEYYIFFLCNYRNGAGYGKVSEIWLEK